MDTKREILSSNKTKSLPFKWMDGFEDDFGNEEVLEDNCLIPKATGHLGTVLRSGSVRPLSPTLKVNSPESGFPGVAMLSEGFDNMCEWIKTIEFVGFFARKGNMFNSKHHRNMRTKFLQVRLRCLDTIMENPSCVHQKPDDEDFVELSAVTAEKIMKDERLKIKDEVNVDQENCVENKLVYKNGDLLLEKQQGEVDKEIVFEGFERNKEDEKLKSESLQEALNIETQNETTEIVSGVDRKHYMYHLNNEYTEELMVVGKSLQPNDVVGETQDSTFVSHDDVNKELSSELVLEDIADIDITATEVLPLKKEGGLKEMEDLTKKMSEQQTDSEVKQPRRLSRLQRLRRRIRNLFSCLGKNRVTPIDI